CLEFIEVQKVNRTGATAGLASSGRRAPASHCWASQQWHPALCLESSNLMFRAAGAAIGAFPRGAWERGIHDRGGASLRPAFHLLETRMSEQQSQQPSADHSRRTFIKGSAAVVAGGAMLGMNQRIARSAHVGGSDEIKIGLIGCGGRGRGAATQ